MGFLDNKAHTYSGTVGCKWKLRDKSLRLLHLAKAKIFPAQRYLLTTYIVLNYINPDFLFFQEVVNIRQPSYCV